jgi:hypothetical protein
MLPDSRVDFLPDQGCGVVAVPVNHTMMFIGNCIGKAEFDQEA